MIEYISITAEQVALLLATIEDIEDYSQDVGYYSEGSEYQNQARIDRDEAWKIVFRILGE